MGRDVLARTLARIAVEPVQGLHQGAAKASQATFHGIQHFQIADEYTDHRGQVRGAPVAVDIGLAGTDRTVAGHQPPDRRVEHLDLGAEAGMGVAERQAFITFDNHQLAMTQLFKLTQHRATQQAGTDAAAGAHGVFGRSQARAFHGGLPSIRGERRANRLQRPGG